MTIILRECSELEKVELSILAVLDDVYETSPWTLEQIRSDLNLDTTEYFFEYDEDHMIAFLSIQQLIGEIEITNIAVKKAYQGQGVAGRLLSNLAERGEDLFLEVRESNEKAQKLYQKNGFKQVGVRKGYYSNPIENALVMRREGYVR